MKAYFGRFTIEMTKVEAESVSHSGPCDNDVSRLLKLPKIKRQLMRISDEDLSDELDQYGAWDNDQLLNRGENEARIIWIAGGNIKEARYL